MKINCKKTDAIPIQEVNGKQVQIVDKAKYLGDIFNKKGDYKDLMDDRARGGTDKGSNGKGQIKNIKLHIVTDIKADWLSTSGLGIRTTLPLLFQILRKQVAV